jgi:hypothetical protein
MHSTIHMLIVEYVKHISRLWIVSFFTYVMLRKSYLKFSAGLAQHEYGVKLTTKLRPRIRTP